MLRGSTWEFRPQAARTGLSPPAQAALLFSPVLFLLRGFQGRKNATFRESLHGPFRLLI
jgi:hypothetical protein